MEREASTDSMVTIAPHIEFQDLPSVLSHLSPGLTDRMVLKGERATWPHLSNITNRLLVEKVLEDVLVSLDVRQSTQLYERLKVVSQTRIPRPKWTAQDSRRKRTKSMH